MASKEALVWVLLRLPSQWKALLQPLALPYLLQLYVQLALCMHAVCQGAVIWTALNPEARPYALGPSILLWVRLAFANER